LAQGSVYLILAFFHPLCFSTIHLVSLAMAALLLACLVAVASAKSFLHADVSAISVEQALLSELSGMADAAQLESLHSIEESLAPMYAALPKNSHGGLEPATVRYALHRYFMQKHGWYVNGLGPVNDTNRSISTTILKDRAPAFIQQLFEQRLLGKGLGHHDLAVFAATLTDLVHKEVSGSLTSIYGALNLPTLGSLAEHEYQLANQAYLLTYLSGGEADIPNLKALPDAEREYVDRYPTWGDTVMWSGDLLFAHDLSQQSRRNPFVPRSRSFEQQVPFLQELGHRLGAFQNLECHRLKDKLVEMEDVGTGRVPLSRFYRNGLAGKWEFTESVGYLRHVGALDDRDPKRMSVVIPNYIQSESNCLAGSSFYSVCCFDECEGLLGHLERELRGSSAAPSNVLAAVARLSSDTVHAPRNLSVALQARLGGIAQIHGGIVPLHGRLFTQWMHHAYPRECRFPHVIGAVNRISPNEWMDAMDLETVEASEGDMELLVSYDEQGIRTGALKAEALPWSMVEELVAGHTGHVAAHSSMPSLRTFSAIAVLASLAAPWAWTSKVAVTERRQAGCWV